MARIASDALIERLADWGVDTVFGLPGDGINGIMEALRRNQDKVRFVLVHHEEAAAFMATAHAKATGKIGVCLATSGPGGIHLLNGLYDAKLGHMPVLAITGMQETSILGTGYQQEVALDKLYQDVAEYDQMIYNPVQLPAIVDIAIRTAYARRGVAHITVPNDIQVADADADPWQHVAPAAAPKTSAVYLSPPSRPAAQVDDRDHAVPGQGPAASVVSKCADPASGFLSPDPGSAPWVGRDQRMRTTTRQASSSVSETAFASTWSAWAAAVISSGPSVATNSLSTSTIESPRRSMSPSVNSSKESPGRSDWVASS